MNRSPDTEIHRPQPDSPDPSVGESAGWLDAIIALVSSRISLIRLEARGSARHTISRVVRVIAAAFCILFSWLLLVAGGIGALAAATQWPWHWIAISAALLHVIATIALLSFRKSGQPAFPLTRAEFEKDRQWIENLNKKNASGN